MLELLVRKIICQSVNFLALIVLASEIFEEEDEDENKHIDGDCNKT